MLLRALELTRRYGGVQALRGVSLEIAEGEVHGLVGANGAGKSTLLKIICGLVQPNSGELMWDAHTTARKPGQDIGLVMQESQLCEGMTVAENISLGSYPTRVPGVRVVDRRAMRFAAAALLESVGVEVAPSAPVAGLSLGIRRMVEVAKALARHPRLLILDEPTAALDPEETAQLLSLTRRISRQGVSVIFVTHRLDEVASVCDRVTVLRDGATVGTLEHPAISVARLVDMVSGEESEAIPRRTSTPGAARLRAGGLSSARFRDIDVTVHSGECVVLTGLVGSGRSSLLQALVGLVPSNGVVEIDGAPLPRRRSPRVVLRRGVRFLPEDRGDGLLTGMSVMDNLVLPTLASGKGSRWSLLRRREARRTARFLVKRFGIKVADLNQPIYQLSGGNQQKVMLAACMGMNPGVTLVDEPTHGIDVAAKTEVHRMLLNFTQGGGSVLAVMSEPEECLEVGDRLIVMRHGELVGEVPADEASKASLTRLGFGHARES